MGFVYAPQQHWDNSFENVKFVKATQADPLRRWIEDHFGGGAGSVLELGCVPGTYLSVFGDLGYEVNGIDLMPRVSPDLEEWMKAQSYRTGVFERGDVFEYGPARQFDVVCSFGLIEHFDSWAELIRKHASLTRPGGYVAISTPNFRGLVQRILHSKLSRKDFLLHNLNAMVPEQWASILKDCGFQVLEAGYLGRFDFWGGGADSPRYKRGIARVIRRTIPALRILPKNVRAYSPYCILVAQKLPA